MRNVRSTDIVRSAARLGQALVPRSPGAAWILAYHLVGQGTELVIDSPRQEFAEHLDMLWENCDVIGLDDLVDRLKPGAAAATAKTRPSVVLTFDDAFLNFYEVALPMLAERRIPAVLYVPAAFLNGEDRHPLDDARYTGLKPMTWAQVAEAAGSGVTIGSHSYHHRDLRQLSEPDLLTEFESSADEIQRRTGVRPTSVCYPLALANAAVSRAAGRFYSSGVVAGGVAVPARIPDLLRLPRLPVRAGTSVERLAAILERRVCLEEWAASKVRARR